MSEPTITFGVNEGGHIVLKATNDGVLLSKEEAERVASYISELKALVHEMYAVLNTPTWDRLDRNTDGKESVKFEQRMAALGLLGGDAE